MNELLERIQTRFDAMARINAPAIHEAADSVWREIRSLPRAERDRLCEALFASRRFENGALVCYVYRRFAKECGAREFRMFARWMDRYVDNWGLTDGVSLWLLGASILNEPALIAELPKWTRSKNRWKRRAAAVSLVYPAKRGLYTQRIFEIAELLLADPDDMVQKGVGWLLKETYPKKPGEVVRFLLPHRATAPRLVLRYAAEKMTAADRERVLGVQKRRTV